MKKTVKRMIACVAIIMIVFALCTTAYAAGTTSHATFSATTCYKRFTTSNSVSKPSGSGDWDWMRISPTSITYTPSSPAYFAVFRATPKCGSVTINDEIVVNAGDIESCYCYGENGNPGRWIIINNFGPDGPNMKTNGRFWGTYK